MSKVITHYFFVQSPWAFLGIRRAMEIAKRHNATIDHRPVKSSEIFKHGGGVPLKQRPIPRQEYRMVELKRWRKFLDIPLNENPKFFPVNEALAAGTIIAAKLDGQDVSNLVATIMENIWIDERDAAAPETIAEALSANGLSDKYLAQANDQAVLETYDSYTEAAKAVNIFGVPTYFIGDEMFWGQDRLDFVDRALAD
ncbi:2-hydroxychromene-2-carboxylate isomerase [Thalassospira marina]|uniref:2-hydroxychromene-2-carboxylate isomerase n=1 Tax=Thalassospira marina TaxID=2048283 RepID=A0A2N3KXN0_9PROT|nr:2-hydroxychromene-2-carboxylate isomerase [Thalassospira marina]AUG53293.1 disulfide bond formation protein DsbA [Thalassospira marina]PKR55312.1 disulfide bond formation protein DsbA [Thalassospira marina]